ncbi:MAG: NAD-dependent epimerase/dehydratase family protein [Gammaproteobacteria bacterium]|nr:NAD-dependent epimerase/dehydratase family protein [Gammaproteobacteria bacterium]
MKALVIGGTGPTGPYLVNGLIERGYQVSILHRGTHDSDEIPRHVERIIGDPHFKETLTEALGSRRFDLVIATYGRIRYVAEVLQAHTDRLITVGGAPCYRGLTDPERLRPAGFQVPLPEDAPKVESEAEFRFGYLVRITEEAVMEAHHAGAYVATHFRYPVIYGPRQVQPTVWAIMRRALDKRDYIVLPDGGLTVTSRGYAENVAQAVLLAVDRPEAAGGQIYNCADVHQLSMRQWVELVMDAMGTRIEVIGIPDSVADVARDLMMFRSSSHHQLFDLFKIRSELGYTDKVPVPEAMQRTVRWYMDNPPAEKETFKSDLAAHYRSEDALVSIYREAMQRYADVPVTQREFHHSYPHPKQAGLSRDHRER